MNSWNCSRTQLAPIYDYQLDMIRLSSSLFRQSRTVAVPTACFGQRRSFSKRTRPRSDRFKYYSGIVIFGVLSGMRLMWTYLQFKYECSLCTSARPASMLWSCLGFYIWKGDDPSFSIEKADPTIEKTAEDIMKEANKIEPSADPSIQKAPEVIQKKENENGPNKWVSSKFGCNICKCQFFNAI